MGHTIPNDSALICVGFLFVFLKGGGQTHEFAFEPTWTLQPFNKMRKRQRLLPRRVKTCSRGRIESSVGT